MKVVTVIVGYEILITMKQDSNACTLSCEKYNQEKDSACYSLANESAALHR